MEGARLNPKITAEMQQHVQPTLVAINKACRAMRAKKVPLDDEVYRRACWAVMSLRDLECALRHAAAVERRGLFDEPPEGEA